MNEFILTIPFRATVQGTVTLDLRPHLPQIARWVTEYQEIGMVVSTEPAQATQVPGVAVILPDPTQEQVDELLLTLVGRPDSRNCRRILHAINEAGSMTKEELRAQFGPRWGSSLSSVGKAASKIGLRFEGGGPSQVRNIYDISDDWRVWSITLPTVQEGIRRLVAEGVWL